MSQESDAESRASESRANEWNDTEAFDRYRPYLQVLAQQAVPAAMRARVDPSDLVQQTIAEAWRCKDQFRGDAMSGHLPWLRGILTHVAAANIRTHMGTQSRDVSREVAITQLLNRTDAKLDGIAIASSLGPASAAQHNEQVVALTTALEKLSNDHRKVLIWRHFDELSHAEIAERLGKSEAAARMLWIRALKSLKDSFQRR